MTPEVKQRIEQIRQGIVPEGYKKTKSDIVPIDWKESSIGEYICEYTEKTTIPNQYPVLTSARTGLMLQTEYYSNRQVTTENNVGYNILPFGYVTFRSRSDDGRFRFNENRIIKRGIISYFYPVFSFSEEVCHEYMLYLLNFSIYRRMYPYAEGTAQQVLSLKKLGQLKYSLPPVREQRRIAEILTTQDKAIELQGRKIEELKRFKQGCLERMFPRKGQKVPEKRFPGFTDDWEQRKFDELYEKVSEKNDLTYGKEDIISVANMYYKPDSYITDPEYLKTYNVFHLGDIAFEGNKSKNFAHGRFVENTIGNGIVSHVFDVFRPKMEYDLLFWKYAINNERIMGNILVRSTKASTMMTNLVAADFLQESISVPSIDEQRQIGAFIDQLDNLITLHQRKLEEMKKQKKALMQLLLTGIVRTKGEEQ